MAAPNRCLVTVIIFTIIIIGILAVTSLIMGFLIALHSPYEENDVTNGDGERVNPTMAPDTSEGDPEEPMVSEREYADQRIWLIHVGEYNHRIAYLDEVTQQPMGFDVDVVNAVCRLSRKRCRLVFDIYANCYSNGKIGRGLTDGYYHACAGWAITYERLRSGIFTDQYQQAAGSYWVTKRGSPSTFDPSNVRDVQIGFVSGWNTNSFCVNRLFNTQGLPLSDNQISYYDDIDDLVEALDDGMIDTGFIAEGLIDDSRMQRVSQEIDTCNAENLGVLTKPTSVGVEFVKWFNEGLNRLLFSREYNDICDRLETVHGQEDGGGKTDICLTDYI